MTQRKRWLKTREFEKGECVAVRRPGKADTDRNARRPPFVCVLVWVYFVHERFESGFRDLTLCVKVLRCLMFPTVNFALIDSDCVPTSLFEIAELVNLMTDKASRAEAMQHNTMASSSQCPPAVLLATEAKC